MSRFHVCLAETLKWEGGYSNDPVDPGGPTMCGIIQRVYDAWRDRHHAPRRSVREIERAEIESIYHANYWQLVRGDELPRGIDLAVFDFGVNSGPGTGIKALQRALGIKEDGHLGPATLQACYEAERAGRAGEIVALIMQRRRQYLRSLAIFWRFGRGWLRRCDGIEAAAGRDVFPARDAGNVAVMPWNSAPSPDTDSDRQSESQGRAAPPEPATKTYISETTGTIGGLSGGQIGIEAASSINRVKARGPWTIADVLLDLATSPVFWIAVTVLVGAAFAFLQRRWQKQVAA